MKTARQEIRAGQEDKGLVEDKQMEKHLAHRGADPGTREPRLHVARCATGVSRHWQ